MSANRIWVSNPRFTPQRILERTFVGDGALADRLAEQVEQSVGTANKHYNLIAGPAGVGKSHLLALIVNRAEKRFERDELAIAWLPDDPGALASELHLFVAILRKLGVSEAESAELQELDREAATTSARTRVADALGERTLLLCIEQLDVVLDALGELGQRGLRAFLQEGRGCTVLATAREVTAVFTDQDCPFFGFFSVQRHDTMDLSATTKLLAAVARANGDAELASAVKSREHRPTIAALRHMLGGIPVRFVDLVRTTAELATPELLVWRALDDHERSHRCIRAQLSQQQQLLLSWLSRQPGASQVKSVAKACFVAEQTVSPQLRDLRAGGHVTSTRVGRESWYEVSDPLTGMDPNYAVDLFNFLRAHEEDPDSALNGRSTIAKRLSEITREAEPDPRTLLRLPAPERRIV